MNGSFCCFISFCFGLESLSERHTVGTHTSGNMQAGRTRILVIKPIDQNRRSVTDSYYPLL